MPGNQEHIIRDATPDDIPGMAELILTHGKVPENCISDEWVREHLEGIRDGSVRAVIADLRGQIIGVVTHQRTDRFADLQPPHEPEHGYINEIVVHADHQNKGIGTQLFRHAAEQNTQQGRAVYSQHHQKNHASDRMMDRSGFKVVETYDDDDRPEIDGSRKTVIRRKRAED